MQDTPGQLGLAAYFGPLGLAQPGQLGLAVQLAGHVLVRVLDQAGRPVAAGLTLTLSYPGPDAAAPPTTETLAYAAAQPVRRTLPPGTLLQAAAAGPGFDGASASCLVPASGQATCTLVVRRRRAGRLLRWRVLLLLALGAAGAAARPEPGPKSSPGQVQVKPGSAW